jgi:hypothetical protein
MLGEINNHVMMNNDVGNMIDKWLQKIPECKIKWMATI